MDAFQRCKAAGETAEVFIERYGKSLLFPPDDPRIVFMLKRFEPEQGYFTDWPEHVERNLPLELGDTRRTNEVIHIEGGDLDARVMDPRVKSEEQGWIEVKAANDNALIRFGTNNSPSVPFELYSNFDTKTPGWLWHFTHPYESLERRKTTHDGLRTITPGALVFCQYEGRIGDTAPYAVVSFYDFSALRSALIEIAQERYGWSIEDWDLSSKTEDQQKRIKRETKDTNWNVCLEWLKEKDVPFVVYLLGNPPHIEYNAWYRQNMITWENLKKMAAAHYELEQLKGKHEELKLADEEPEWNE